MSFVKVAFFKVKPVYKFFLIPAYKKANHSLKCVGCGDFFCNEIGSLDNFCTIPLLYKLLPEKLPKDDYECEKFIIAFRNETENIVDRMFKRALLPQFESKTGTISIPVMYQSQLYYINESYMEEIDEKAYSNAERSVSQRKNT